MRALEIALSFTGILFGLAVAGGGALLLGRSKAAAGFAALAGLGYAGAATVSALLDFAGELRLHVSPAAWQLAFTVISVGRSVVFYGSLALALRALAQSSEAAR